MYFFQSILSMDSIDDYLLLNISKFLTINDIFKLLQIDNHRYQLLIDDKIWKILLDKLLIEYNEEIFDAHKLFENSTHKETFWLVFDLHQLKKINELKNKTIVEIWNLRELYLTYNQIKEIRLGNQKFPKQITSLTNLQKLYLPNNQIKEIPPQIASLTNLQSRFLFLII